MKSLIGLVNDIDQQIPIAMEDKVLIAISLNSETKIKKYAQWIRSRLKGDMLNATETEIIQTAVKIGKEEW